MQAANIGQIHFLLKLFINDSVGPYYPRFRRVAGSLCRDSLC